MQPYMGRSEVYPMDPTLIKPADAAPTLINPGGSDPTVVKQPDPDQALVRAEGLSGVEAHEHSPTLMAGETAGAQGKVRVWAPDPGEPVRPMLVEALLWGQPLLLWAVLVVLMPHPLPVGLSAFGVIAVMVAAWRIAASLPQLMRRRYIATDDAGIAVTTFWGTRAFRWDEVVAWVDTTLPLETTLCLVTEETVHLNLHGYPDSTRARLRKVIASSAGLEEVPASAYRPLNYGALGIVNVYTRPGARILDLGAFTHILPPDQHPSVLPPPALDNGGVDDGR